MLLQDEEWGAWSDREIGRRCAVHHETVARIKAEPLAKTPDTPRTVSRGGKVYTMGTARIGRLAAEPVPVDPPAAPADDAGNVEVLG